MRPVDHSWAHTAALGRAGTKVAPSEDEEKRKARELTAKWDAQRAARESKEERERWWRFARMQYGEAGVNAEVSEEDAGAAAVTARAAKAGGGTIDYSWWDKWAAAPDDPTSIAEREREAHEKERAADLAFEKANPGFVAQFQSDADKRAAAEAAKLRRAERVKEKGNGAFKAGDMKAALGHYFEAIRIAPFTVAALNNIAATCLSMEDAEGAVEFASRVLFVEKLGSPAASKASFRRAMAHRLAGQLELAEADLAVAAKHEPLNSEVVRELAAARLELLERAKEARVSAAVGTAAGSAGPAISDRLLAMLRDAGSGAALALPVADVAQLAAALEPLARGGPLSTDGALEHAAGADEDARVYFRTCGLLEALMTVVTESLGGPGEASRLSCSAAAEALAVLTASARNAKNLSVLIDGKLLMCLLDMLALPAGPSTSGDGRPLLVHRALLFILNCLSPRSPAAVRAAVGKHPFFSGRGVAGSSSVSSCLLAAAGALATDPEVPEETWACARACVSILHTSCMPAAAATASSGKGRKAAPTDAATTAARAALIAAVEEFAAPGTMHPVTVLLQVVTVLVGRSMLEPLCLHCELMQASVSALAALAHVAALRPAFGATATAVVPEAPGRGIDPAALRRALMAAASAAELSLPVPSASSVRGNRPAGPSPALHPLVDILRLPADAAGPPQAGGGVGPWEAVRGSALAALANASVTPLDGSGGVLAALAACGAVPVLLGFLGAAAGSNVPSAVERARAALVLGRLSGDASASASLCEAGTVSRLTCLLAASMAGGDGDVLEGQYADGLVRLLAASTSSGIPAAEACLAAGGPSALVAMLRAAVPTLYPPTLPGRPARHVGVGNAAKALIALSAFKAALPMLVAAGAVPVLVDALKAPSGDAKEGPGAAVRKNAAVALARLAADAGGHTALVETGGLRVLLQLGKGSEL